MTVLPKNVADLFIGVNSSPTNSQPIRYSPILALGKPKKRLLKVVLLNEDSLFYLSLRP
jgi:hypothetical protein